MTKSGIGTLQHQHQQHHIHQSNGQSGTSQLANMSNASSSSSTSSLISNAEIPIWVADKKKWVTGISKKTTINDLIYAILKQCQLVPSQQSNSTSNGKTMESNNFFDQIAQQYVLIEYTLDNCLVTGDSQNEQFTSQRVLSGDSKVYKYLNKWANSQLMSQQQQPQQHVQPNLMLKILQRETTFNSEHSSSTSIMNEQPSSTPTNTNTTNTTNTTSSTTASLATKLLKKFGVTQPINNNNNNNNSNKTVLSTNNVQNNNGNNNNNNNNNGSYRFVDVKLPNQLSSSHSQPNQLSTKLSPNNTTNNNNINSNNDNNNTVSRNFDPNTQKSFLYNAIMEKDNKLKQQVKRFQLIDELIKETEKKSKITTTSALLSQINSESVNNPTYTYSPSSQSSSLSSTSSSISNPPMNTNNSNTNVPNQQTVDANSKQFNTVDLNDIYCHFPEMCTHHLKEVEDFTLMCSQLFQLEEAIKSQKQMLSNLESDLQRELNQNQFTSIQHQQQVVSPLSPSSAAAAATAAESVETVELRNEVNYSREQTRLQCKQLHDLDLRMRQNEQSLMVKEQQLQQLLEELYIQEIYADNALETAINTQTTVVPTTPTNPQQLFLSAMMLNNNNNNNYNSNSNTPINVTLNSPIQQVAPNTKDIELGNGLTELVINNDEKNKTINNNNNNNYLTKRHVKMYGDSNDDMLINHALMQQQQQQQQQQHQLQNSIKINNQSIVYPQQQQFNLNSLQQKSQSIGNLTKSGLPSPPIMPTSVLVSNNQLTASNQQQQHQHHQQFKQISSKSCTTTTHFVNSTNLNVNSDHSGDNDSGISSMSSETTTNQNCILNTNTNGSSHLNPTPPPYIQPQQQRPIIQNNQYNQYLNSSQQQFQQQVYRQPPVTQQASPVAKSVLETLV